MSKKGFAYSSGSVPQHSKLKLTWSLKQLWIFYVLYSVQPYLHTQIIFQRRRSCFKQHHKCTYFQSRLSCEHMEERKCSDGSRAHPKPYFLLPSYSLLTELELLLLSRLAMWTSPLCASKSSLKSLIRATLHLPSCYPFPRTSASSNQDKLEEDPCHITGPSLPQQVVNASVHRDSKLTGQINGRKLSQGSSKQAPSLV